MSASERVYFLSSTRSRLVGVIYVDGNKAKGMVAVSEKEAEKKLTTLQGLAFVFLGFLLQSAGALLDLFTFR